MWSTPRHVVVYVLLVDVLALATVGLPHAAVTHSDWVRFAVLAGCSLAYVELTRGVEQVREVTAKAGPYMDTASVWCFAAVVVLPAILASAIVALIYVWAWIRVHQRRRPMYRWAFSGATVIIATQIAAAVLALAPGPHPGMPSGTAGWALAVAAAAARWLINYALVVGAILLSSPNLRAADILHTIDERVLELGAVGLGLVAAGTLSTNPALLAGIVAGLVAMHRGILLAQYRKAARTDATTTLPTVTWWREIAGQAVARASGAGATLGVLVLDLDHFKDVNDTHGHIAGDEVLRSVGLALRAEIRDYDTAGRWGGEEFVVLLTDVTSAELAVVAERIRCRIHNLVITVTGTDGPATVRDLTISIGGAAYPTPGLDTLDDLVLAADKALYQAKNDGRDRVHLTSD